MRINDRFSSMMTNGYIRKNQELLELTMKRLSSGKRINSAADDAAGLNISTGMTSQIKGMDKSKQNVDNGISLLQTADGGASAIQDIVQRMRELSVQASNGTYQQKDLESLDAEFQQLKNQIDNTASSTTFNNIKIINMNGLAGVDPAVITQLQTQIPLWVDDALENIKTNLGIALPIGKPVNVKLYTNPSESRAAYMGTSDGGASFELGINLSKLLDGSGQIPAGPSGGQFDTVIAHEIVHGLQFSEMANAVWGASSGNNMWFIEGLATSIQGGNGFLSGISPKSNATISASGWGGSSNDYGSAFAAVKTLHEITVGGIQAFVDRLEAGDTLDQAFQNTTQTNQGEFSSGVVNFTSNLQFINWFNTSTEVDAYLNSSSDFTAGDGAILPGAGNSNPSTQPGTIANNGTIENPATYILTFDAAQNNGIRIHTGYAHDDAIDLSTFDLSSSSLNISGLNLLSQTDAEFAIDSLDAALDSLSNSRSYYGSSMNRLTFINQNLSSGISQTSQSKMRIEDSDMAKEMSVHTKSQVLLQSTMSMFKNREQQINSIIQLLQNS